MSRRPLALIVGAGLTGAVAANYLSANGWGVEVVEANTVWGGNIRTESLNGVLYEPHGAHIFHTNDLEIVDYLAPHWKLRPYTHTVKTEAFGRVMSWPPQVSELEDLPEWKTIKVELDLLPEHPDGTNFETYAISIMGETLYHEFIYGYTLKQWNKNPQDLAASFAPKRIDLRRDGYRGLFRDKVQGWPVNGWTGLVDSLLSGINVSLGTPVTWSDVDTTMWDAVIVTAPLDQFLDLPDLPWRGVSFRHDYIPLTRDTVLLDAPVVNNPNPKVAYTRRIETKQMSGQNVDATIISYEFPGADARHYPIDDAEGINREYANSYKRRLTERIPQAVAAGRLANYVYIDTWQAARQGLNAGRGLMRKIYE